MKTKKPFRITPKGFIFKKQQLNLDKFIMFRLKPQQLLSNYLLSGDAFCLYYEMQ